MYTQARFFIRTALANLLAAFLVGAIVLLNQAFEFDGRLSTLMPVFYHLLMVGWVTQLICGVSLWMFPPFSRERPRGNEQFGWLSYGALNAGLWLRVIFEPLHTWVPDSWYGIMLVPSALLQVFAIWMYVVAIWPRVKGKK